MVIGDEVEAVALLLQLDVLLDRAEVVAQVQLARGLHAAENSLTLGCGVHANAPPDETAVRANLTSLYTVRQTLATEVRHASTQPGPARSAQGRRPARRRNAALS